MKELSFKTNEFSTSVNRYVKSILLKVLSRWCWLPIILFLLCFILTITLTLKFIFVALILLFLIVPTALMFVYFYHSTTQEARIAILKKVITINEEGIKIDFSPIKKYKTEEYSSENDPEYFKPQSCFIPRENVCKVENMGSYISVQLKGGKYKFITIPLGELNGDVNAFLAYILHYCDIKDL